MRSGSGSKRARRLVQLALGPINSHAKIGVLATLRTANTAAVLNLGKGGALNEARVNV
jgi:hypothetical protein